jgi:serine/threonine-protein kinase
VLQSRYRILQRLALGSMGAVYAAERIHLKRRVAVKFLHTRIAGDPQFTRRFEREALAMSQLSHPHCVSVIDFGVADAPYIVMDLAEGRTLQEILREGRLDPPRAVHICRQVLSGLDHAHQRGIVHRDVKPSNVIITEYACFGDHARLLDFGLAALQVPDPSGRELTRTRVVVGTPSYMSPEQSRGERVDPRADVYGAGVLLFQMLTGRRPFEADDTMKMLEMHRQAPVPSLSARCPDAVFSAELEEVVATALIKDPSQRFATALEFATALALVPEGRASGGSSAAWRGATDESAAFFPSRRRRAPMLIAIGCAAMLSAVGWVVLKPFAAEKGAHAGTGRRDSAGSFSDTASSVASTPSFSRALSPSRGPAASAPSERLVYGPEAPPASTMKPALPLFSAAKPENRDGEAAADAGSPAIEPAIPKFITTAGTEAKTVAEARALAEDGFKAAAIAALEKLRKKQPKNTAIPYLLGTLYCETGDYARGMERYRAAVKKNPRYRTRLTVNKMVIRALANERSRSRARRLALRQLGVAALPYLKRAARHDEDPVVREQAQKLLDQLNR